MRTNGSTEVTPQRIRQARQAKGLSQDELAEQIGYHQTTVSYWETGECGASWSALRLVADALDVSLAWLRGEAGAEGPPIARWEFRQENPGKLFCGVCRRNSTMIRREVERISGQRYPRFCPWCGARLESEEDKR